MTIGPPGCLVEKSVLLDHGRPSLPLCPPLRWSHREQLSWHLLSPEACTHTTWDLCPGLSPQEPQGAARKGYQGLGQRQIGSVEGHDSLL